MVKVDAYIQKAGKLGLCTSVIPFNNYYSQEICACGLFEYLQKKYYPCKVWPQDLQLER